MIVKITMVNDDTRYTEAKTLEDVADMIAKGQPVRCFWYSAVTGERWEERALFLEGARHLQEETNEPRR
jgi:hypothetical protein